MTALCHRLCVLTASSGGEKVDMVAMTPWMQLMKQGADPVEAPCLDGRQRY